MSTVIKYNGYDVIPCYDVFDSKTDKQVIAKECKFVRHIPKTNKIKDTHIISLVHHYEDGTAAKELKIVNDYKRPLWVTKKIHRNHKDKKEFEHVDKLQLVPTTQSDIDINACRALDLEPTPYNIRTIKDSPYLYAYDVPSTAHIKYFYRNTNNDYVSPFKVVNLDIEADITGEFGDVTIITLSTPGFRHTAAVRRLYSKLYSTDEEIITAIKKKSAKELPKGKALEQCKIYDVSLHKNDLEMVKFLFGMVHVMMPDFVTFHNMVYDLSTIIGRLEKYNYSPGDIFSDPNIPKEYRGVIFNPAKQHKIKKGIKYSIPYEEQWTTIDISATFMIMDTMTGYDAIRQGQGKLVGGYGLDNILEKNNLKGKLFYEDENTKYLSKGDWHKYMSTKRPVEYTIYGEQDTVAMTDLELLTEDFSIAMPIIAGIADFNRFNSAVHKATCNAFLENRHKGLIVGTTPKTVIDRSYLGTKYWIKTLPSNHIQDIGLMITNLPNVTTNVTAHADDLDCVSSYPSDIQACNVALDTLVAEITAIDTFQKSVFKDSNINLISSNANIIEYTNTLMNMPTAICMLDLAKQEYLKSSL